jgi:glyoxylate reductase
LKPLVFVTRRIPKEGLNLLEGFRVKVYRGTAPIPRDRLKREIKEANALISLLTDRIDRDVLRAGKKLIVVANYAVGYDNIDLAAAYRPCGCFPDGYRGDQYSRCFDRGNC